MQNNNIETKVENLIKDKITSLGYELYDIEYVKLGKEYHLCIYVDKEGLMDINDCEKISEIVDPMLDEADFIKEQYFLEVSSSGLEKNLRKFEHYQKQIGKEIEIKLFTKMNDKKEFRGILIEASEEYIVLEVNEEKLKIEFSKISSGKSVYNWEN